MSDNKSIEQISNIVFNHDEIGPTTIKGYLKTILLRLWNEGEGFSSKRPFGNSCWEFDLYLPLIKAGVVEGIIDENGYLDELKPVNEKIANDLIREIINSL